MLYISGGSHGILASWALLGMVYTRASGLVGHMSIFVIVSGCHEPSGLVWDSGFIIM